MFQLIFQFYDDDVELHVSHEPTAYLCFYAVNIKREAVWVGRPGFVAGETDPDGVSCWLRPLISDWIRG